MTIEHLMKMTTDTFRLNIETKTNNLNTIKMKKFTKVEKAVVGASVIFNNKELELIHFIREELKQLKKDAYSSKHVKVPSSIFDCMVGLTHNILPDNYEPETNDEAYDSLFKYDDTVQESVDPVPTKSGKIELANPQ